MVSARSACSKHEGKKKKLPKTDTEIPTTVNRLFEAFRFSFPPEGTVRIQPLGGGKVCIEIDGAKNTRDWKIGAYTLQFKNGKCTSVSQS